MVQVLWTKTGWGFGVLHLSESDANCSRSTKYVSKLVKDFLEELLEKNSDSKIVRLPPHVDFVCGIFWLRGSLSASVESIFSLGIKTFFAQRG